MTIQNITTSEYQAIDEISNMSDRALRYYNKFVVDQSPCRVETRRLYPGKVSAATDKGMRYAEMGLRSITDTNIPTRVLFTRTQLPIPVAGSHRNLASTQFVELHKMIPNPNQE